MKKNKNIIIAIVLICVLAVALFIGIRLANKDNHPTDVSTTEQTVSTTEHTETAPTANPAEDSTTAQTTTAKTELSKDILSKSWYLFDNDKLTCYTFKFNKNGKVDIAYFSSANINGDDAQYTNGSDSYTIKGDKIIIKDLPDEFPISDFSFDIKGKKVYSNKTELEPKSDVNLNDVLAHFV